MTSSLPTSLYLKSVFIGSAFEAPLLSLRELSKTRQRRKHPELLELYQEPRWLPLVLRRLLKEDSRWVDVGCHIGSFLSQLRKYAPKGRHIAFEASSTKCRWLRNRFPDVEVLECAVAAERGRAVFVEEYAHSGYSRLKRHADRATSHSRAYEVDVCCLDDILSDKGKIDIIKIDIEGGELAALQGARAAVCEWHPAIIFECGPEEALKQQASSRKDLFDFLTRDLGYGIFSFGDFLFAKGHMQYDEFRRCGVYPFRAFNFLALPPRVTERPPT